MREESTRVTSTANRMGRAWFRRLLGLFIWLDLVLGVLALGFCVYTAERAELKSAWSPDIQREVHLFRGRDLPYWAFRGLDGEWVEVDIGGFVRSAMPFAQTLLAVEFIELCRQGIWGAHRARKPLRPIDRMAAAARELTRLQNQPKSASEGEKLQGLEEAIGRIEPGQQLRTGDIELEGLEKAINAMLSRMHESYRQQAQFVSDASHELRTPVAVIQGYAGMLDRWGKSDPKVLDEGIEAIRSESDYMKKLIDQLLFLARGDTGRNRMELKKVSLDALVREARDDAALIDPDHEWIVSGEEDVYTRADADMLKQCVRVLTENASRYTPKGGSVRLRAMANAKGEACFEVQDTGAGISGADLEHIFDRFYRADAARSRENGGTGLGLSIAKWIVENHGGHFEVLSREGLGTRFTVCLPAWKDPT